MTFSPRSAALAALAALAAAAGLRAAGRPASTHDWPTFGFDIGRPSASPAPTGIDASSVGSLHRQQVQLDGTVDASVIYLHDVRIAGGSHDALFMTTTYGKTLAVDAHDGTILWRYVPPDEASWDGSRQITNSTPVADPSREFIYAASPDGRVQKLAVADGHAVWRTAITNLPTREKIASPLGYYHGRVIATTGGYIGDAPPYQGHVAILDASTGRLTHVWNSLCSDTLALLDPSHCAESGSAIWGRAGAVVDTTTGAIFVGTGNGRWDGHTYWGDATLELDSTASVLLGNYTPTNTDELDARDADIGSTSPALLGGGYVAQGGKDGLIRVLDPSVMGGSAAHRGGELQSVPTPSGARLFTALAVQRTDSATLLFAADRGATAAWSFRDGRLTPLWHNTTGGTSPVVAGGLLYVYDPNGGLHVYEPATGKQVALLDCGAGHWSSPIVVDGLIALPEGNANDHSGNGTLDIWRLP